VFHAGKLIHSITIQKNTPTRDASGAEIESWSTHADRKSWIRPLTGNEKYVNQQILATADYAMGIRYCAGATSKMRVKYGSRYFDIKHIADPEERHHEMILLCKELV
jgi:SPP1 family predicted phage head-tail adaptor